MSKLRVGLIGTGVISRDKHLPALTKMENIEITVLCDVDVAKAEKVKEDYALAEAKITADWHEVVADPQVDVIHVLTPNPLHYEMTMEALKAGKHVYCEKPMALKYSECLEMIEQAKKSGKKLTTGTQWRYNPAPMKMKEMIKEGYFGDIYYINSQQLRPRRLPAYGVYTNKELNGGGVLMDGGPHSIDLPMWLTDNYEVKSVYGVTFDKMKNYPEGNDLGPWDPDNFDVEDTAIAEITMKNGMVIHMETAWAINMMQPAPGITASIAGTKAGADMVGPGFEDHLRLIGVKDGKFGVETVECTEKVNMFEYDLNCWIKAIENDTDPAVLPEQGAVVTKVIEAIYESARTGQVVYFD
ncbi:MAG TPA: Gfo/Idh/MocA family oxidoreductase [Candidatus Blautia faecavium]|uniref:Gfo/Idh/MocA family oxidoreductase n=1 Tax=Candidatus Blautia faecavium TaxID=2838487 RepID=A0A9D2LR79_9FIRM|nr:Gfo/Idh/MocA family oxidoreductase [Candidatus Blautia faecavium]